MKASLKFRDDQKPLFRAKVPLCILGLPFQSGIVAGDSKELTLNLGTFFESGPSIKLAYRPNDSWNPFSLIFKTGSGPFGSPISSTTVMSAEFNLLGRGNPAFMLYFKPQFGDFSIKKSHSSVFDRIVKSVNGVGPVEDSSIEIVDTPVVNSDFTATNGVFSGKTITVFPSDSTVTSAFSSILSGMEVTAKTTVPVVARAAVNFRWGVRVPAEGKCTINNPMAGIGFHKVPFLVMNKIGIEHVDGRDSKENTKSQSDFTFPGNADLVETCTTVTRQLEILRSDNGLLKKAIEDLRQEITAAKSVPESGNKQTLNGRMDRRNIEKKPSEYNANGFSGKSATGDASEELKKALMGA